MFMFFFTNSPPSNDTMITVHFPQSSIHSGSAPAIDHDLDVWLAFALVQSVPAKVCTRVGQTRDYSHLVVEQGVRNDRCGE